ncbi:hypothetical protein [Marinovum sp.]|uniref:FliH/SctL family protein n=1 Tax=Marinovum sp. TaxID=2024839 RepID=UPI002B2696FC|nr:hypothetical protein [Marinovum sp.]
MSYLFDRNFDAEAEGGPRGAAPANEPMIPLAQFEQALAEARAAAHEAGVQQGRAEAQQTAQSSETTRRLQLAEAVVPVLQALFADNEAHHAALESQMVDFVLSVFEQLAPDVSAALAEGQARREALGAVRMALGAAQLTLYFPPESLEAAAPELEAAAREAGFGGRLSLRPDPALRPGDLRAAWDQGVMSYSFAEICARVLEALGMARRDIEQRLGQKLTGETS